MLKNAYFLEKDVKNRLSVGSSALESPLATPALLLLPTVITLSSSFLALNTVYSLKKKNKFRFFKIFEAIFHFKLCSFCWQVRKNISCPRAQDTLTTPLNFD